MQFDDGSKVEDDPATGDGDRSRSRSGSLVHRRHLKLVVLGSVAVGKTSLLEQFIHNKFTGQYKSTIGADFLTTEVMVGDRLVTLQIWDTAGQERFAMLGQAFYRGAEGCVLVFDKTNTASFRALNAWKEEFLVTCAPPQPETFPFVVVGNKCDKPKPKVARSVAEHWCKNENVPYYETSARDNLGVRDAFMEVVTRALARKPPTDTEMYVPDSLNLNDPPPKKKESSCCS